MRIKKSSIKEAVISLGLVIIGVIFRLFGQKAILHGYAINNLEENIRTVRRGELIVLLGNILICLFLLYLIIRYIIWVVKESKK